MKAIAIIAASGVTVGGLYAGGAFDRGEVYNVPIAQARMRLELMELPEAMFNAAGGSSVSDSEQGDTYTWKVMVGSEKAAVFTARLKAEGPSQTRVTLDYTRPSGRDGWSDKLLSTNFMRKYTETSFHEYVDAAIENRRPDQSEAMQEFAAQAAAHPEDLRELGQATQGIFMEVAEQMKSIEADMKYNQAIYSNSPRLRMEAATRPNPEATRPTTPLPRD